jgi:predicted phage terminase large subunit-like protein
MEPELPDLSTTEAEEYRQALYLVSVCENSWLPQKPTPKQAQFLYLTGKEALYGGAAGGGKSSALLTAALQFADVPGFSALLLRRTYADLSLPGALMDRARAWLGGTAARWSDKEHAWHFPSGATLTFGYLDAAGDKYRYQSSEFQFIGFDELTQFPEQDYLYLFSRLRRPASSRVPLRMRAATNPGGAGHAWVKRRFLSEEGRLAGRVFVSARLEDNPHLDRDEYARALENLDPFTRRQLLAGDWSEFQGNHLHPAAWPRYQFRGDAYLLHPHRIVLARDVWRFAVVDPATDAKKSADYTVMMVVGVTPARDLLVLDVVRRQLDVGDILPALAGACRAWRPLTFVGMESVAFQRLLALEAAKHRNIPPVRELRPQGKGKLARAVPAIVKAERKEIHLPHESPWLDDFVTELASFVGANDLTDDQVDALAYAVLAANTFQLLSDSGVPCLLTPGYQGLGDMHHTPGRTGAMGYGAEGIL